MEQSNFTKTRPAVSTMHVLTITALLCIQWFPMADALISPYFSSMNCSNKSNGNFLNENQCQLFCYSYRTKSNATNDHSIVVYSKYDAESQRCCCMLNQQTPDNTKLLYGQNVGKIPYSSRAKCPELGGEEYNSFDAKLERDYKRLCEYIETPYPLTWLDAKDFALLASHFISERPEIAKRIDSVNELDNMKLDWLDSKFDNFTMVMPRILEEYDGYNLETERIEKFLKINELMGNANKPSLLSDAFNEMVARTMLIEITIAADRLIDVVGGTEQSDCSKLEELNEKLKKYREQLAKLIDTLDQIPKEGRADLDVKGFLKHSDSAELLKRIEEENWIIESCKEN